MNDNDESGVASGELFVASFARGLEVIRSFSEGNERQTLAQISKRAAVTRATARRLIYTLVDLGYAGNDGRQFFLTAKVLDLGYSYLSSQNIWATAQQYMERVVSETSASCSISVLDGDDIIYVARVSPQQLMRRVISVGSRVPAHAVAMGRIQLAALDEPELRKRVMGMPLHSFTSRTITDRNVLLERIFAEGKRGWSLVDRELDEGISGIAMPIRGRNGEVMAAANLSLKPEQVAQEKVVEKLRVNLMELVRKIEGIARNRTDGGAGH